MAKSGNYDEEKNSTVSWVPAFLRDFLGLNSTYQRPEYGRYGNTREDTVRSTTGWVPGFAQHWLGLEYTEPQRYGPSSVDEGYIPPSRPAAPRALAAPPPPPRMIAPSSSSRSSYESSFVGSGKTDYTAPRPEGSGRMSFGQTAPLLPASPPLAGRAEGVITPGAAGQPPRFEGYVEPIMYGVKGYLRGALPPQGLEEFFQLLRKTVTDVTDLYGRTIRFQTEEIVKMVDDFRKSNQPAQTSGVRPIKVERVNATPAATDTGTAAKPTTVSPDIGKPPDVKLPTDLGGETNPGA